MVTDILLIGRVVDLSVYVCCAKYTHKTEFMLINGLSLINKLPNLCFVINERNLLKKYGCYMVTVSMANIMAMVNISWNSILLNGLCGTSIDEYLT